MATPQRVEIEIRVFDAKLGECGASLTKAITLESEDLCLVKLGKVVDRAIYKLVATMAREAS